MIDSKQLDSLRLIAFDFDGVFTDNTVFVSQSGEESVRCCRSDGIGISKLLSVGVLAVIISTEVNPVVSVRAKKLNLPCRQGVLDKSLEIKSYCEERKIDPKLTMFVGNDANDIPAFNIVGIPIGVADSHPCISPFIVWRTEKGGGYGAVREICDLVYDAKTSKV